MYQVEASKALLEPRADPANGYRRDTGQELKGSPVASVMTATAIGGRGGVEPESVPAEQPDGLRAKHAHAGVAMAIATLAMGATSGIQALLYLSSFGIDGRTDGFFIAFALYTSFGVFSQSIRVTSAPLLVGERATVGSG